MGYVFAVVIPTVVTTGAFRLTYGPHWWRLCPTEDCDCPAARAIVHAAKQVQEA